MKKAVWIAAAALALVIVALILVGVLVPSVRESVFAAVGLTTNTIVISGSDQQSANSVAPGEELLAQVETKEDAEALAEQYGITLVRFRSGIAVYHCEDNPFDVIKLGKKNGWTPLYPNHVSTISPIEEGSENENGHKNTATAEVEFASLPVEENP